MRSARPPTRAVRRWRPRPTRGRRGWRARPGVGRGVEGVGRLPGEVLERPIGRAAQREDDEHGSHRRPVDEDGDVIPADRVRAPFRRALAARELSDRGPDEEDSPAELAEEAQDVLDVVEVLGGAVEQLGAEEPGEGGEDEPCPVPADEVAVAPGERERAEAEGGRGDRLGDPDLREVVVVDEEDVVDQETCSQDAAPEPGRAEPTPEDEPGQEGARRGRDAHEGRRVRESRRSPPRRGRSPARA